MTSTGMANHAGRTKLIAEDPIAVEVLAARREIERQDRAFVVQLRAAILAGDCPRSAGARSAAERGEMTNG